MMSSQGCLIAKLRAFSWLAFLYVVFSESVLLPGWRPSREILRVGAMSHAVAALRTERLARSTKPFLARGSRAERCVNCRLVSSHCVCAWRPMVSAQAGVCLLMHDIEVLKPSNTGWLIADVVKHTAAFAWTRTAVDPELPRLLAEPAWQPFLVFPGEYVEPQRRVSSLALEPGRRPLFVILDATWTQARKMFRKSPYLDHLPVLSLQPEELSRYQLRRAKHDGHLCTAQVAALCLELAGDGRAADALNLYLDVFTQHYLASKAPRALDLQDELHRRLSTFV